MRLRITNKGWETYTGMIGPIEFVNGTSVKNILEIVIDQYLLSDINVEIVPDEVAIVEQHPKKRSK